MSHRQHDTHELHVYSLSDGGGYAHEQTIRCYAYPPNTQSGSGTRQTMGGFAVDADMVVHLPPTADSIDDGQSVVLERLNGSSEAAYIVDGKRVQSDRYGGVGTVELACAREEGEDLSLFPDP